MLAAMRAAAPRRATASMGAAPGPVGGRAAGGRRAGAGRAPRRRRAPHHRRRRARRRPAPPAGRPVAPADGGGHRGRPVVGEELAPALAHRRGVGAVAVVHVVDQPGVGTERTDGAARSAGGASTRTTCPVTPTNLTGGPAPRAPTRAAPAPTSWHPSPGARSRRGRWTPRASTWQSTHRPGGWSAGRWRPTVVLVHGSLDRGASFPAPSAGWATSASSPTTAAATRARRGRGTGVDLAGHVDDLLGVRGGLPRRPGRHRGRGHSFGGDVVVGRRPGPSRRLRLPRRLRAADALARALPPGRGHGPGCPATRATRPRPSSAGWSATPPGTACPPRPGRGGGPRARPWWPTCWPCTGRGALRRHRAGRCRRSSAAAGRQLDRTTADRGLAGRPRPWGRARRDRGRRPRRPPVPPRRLRPAGPRGRRPGPAARRPGPTRPPGGPGPVRVLLSGSQRPGGPRPGRRARRGRPPVVPLVRGAAVRPATPGRWRGTRPPAPWTGRPWRPPGPRRRRPPGRRGHRRPSVDAACRAPDPGQPGPGPPTWWPRTAAGLDPVPAVLVSASAVGYYGDRGDEELTEDSSPGTGFLAEVCRDWEEATAPAARPAPGSCGCAPASCSTPAGGALGPPAPPLPPGSRGPAGQRGQYLSWITLPDEVAVLRRALDDPSLAGPVNAVRPRPGHQRRVHHGPGRASSVGRPSWPCPEWPWLPPWAAN